MNFKQLIINLDAEKANQLSDIFFDLGVLSVSIEDNHAGTALEKPIFDEPNAYADDSPQMWSDSKITVLIEAKTNIELMVKEAQKLLGSTFDYNFENVADEDWVRKTQSQFTPIKVTDNLYIVPSWHKSPDINATAITLDPGIAFGTGSHPTTFMCLKWLSKHAKTAHSLLDYGCGSGILAITAKKLGVANVYGTDIDNAAIESSNNNRIQNNVEIKFCSPDELPKVEFDIVVANILSNPLRILAPALANLTKTKLILSGILEEQTTELSTIYSTWFNVVVADVMDGWVLLECS